MERGIEGMEWMHSEANPREPARREALRAGLPEWGGTGLCSEAQADGVPCTALGRDCDTCARAAELRSPRR
jgi:hypothetical protein